MLTTYAAALCFVLASVLVGQAVAALTDQRGGWCAAPAAGLSVLVCLSALVSRAPERPLLLALVPCLALLAAAVVVVLRRPSWPPVAAFCAAAIALPVTAVPFYVNSRSGLLGVSLNNDTAAHLLWAEALRSDFMAMFYGLPEGYPVAAHALMGGLANVTGIEMDQVLNGLLVATAALTTIAAWPLLAQLPTGVRIIGALLVAFAYLPAAYLTQGAFKETMMALFVLSFTAVLARARHARRPWLEIGVPSGLLAAGAIQVYSYLALGWFVSITVAWLVLELLMGGVHDVGPRLRLGLRAVGLPVAAAGVVLIGGLASQADRLASFANQLALSPADAEVGIPVTTLGNLVGKLSAYEALGVWPSPDFRRPPLNAFHAGELAIVGLALVVVGVVVALRRREAALAAAAAASWAIFWVSDRTQSPYVAAKALMLAAPLVTALALGAWPARRHGWENALARITLLVIFALGAAYSTSLVLRFAPVASAEQRQELDAFREIVGKRPTLFLGSDDHVGWWLRGMRFATPRAAAARPIYIPARPEKPVIAGEPVDFDSVSGSVLDTFAYVIAPRSGYASDPPPNFVRIRSERLYELWQRRGSTPPRQTLEPGGAPVARLNCRRAKDRALSRKSGLARVWPTPRLFAAFRAVAEPGASADIAIPLERGRWLLSLKYTSTSPVRVISQHGSWTLPAYTGRRGPYFTLGEVDVPTDGPLGLRLIAEQTAKLGSRGFGLRAQGVAATRPEGTRDLPLSRSCGRYIDWYRLR
jgi:hypothetical protein